MPVQFVPNLIAALQEHMRVFTETYSNVGWSKGTRPLKSDCRRHVARIIETLSEQHPNADTELHYRNAFELLVATILSAQSTDARVNMVTPTLFAKYPERRGAGRGATRRRSSSRSSRPASSGRSRRR